MARLELRESSKWWYGVWVDNKKRQVRNLRIEIDGKPPENLNQTGDRRFEASRAKAQAELSRLVGDPQDRKRAEALVQTLHEIRTGHLIGSVPVSDMYKQWVELPGRKTPQARHLNSVEGVLKRLAEFLTTHHAQIVEMGQVTPSVASDFMVSEAARGVSSRTYNATLSTLKSVFKKLRRKAGMTENPFDDLVTQEENALHRIPFTPAELKSILDHAKSDPFIYPLIVTGICTAMRRGDVCQLKWTDVDLKNRFIIVKASKTGVTVQIPIFPMLFDVLSGLPHKSDYCFPEAAEMYVNNPSGINHRLKKVFRAAGFVDDDEDAEAEEGEENAKTSTPALPEVPREEKRERGMTVLEALTDKDHTAKVRETMKKVFDLYLKSGTVDTIAKDLHIGKGSASLYLNRIEKAVGFAVVRRRVKPIVKDKRGEMHGEHTVGLRKVNQRGFHAFRATWVTLALTAGVPMELVRRVTGHATVEVVLSNYFQPDREEFRNALQDAMPALLTEGSLSRDDQVCEILNNMTSRTWKKDRERALALMTGKPCKAT